MILVRTNPKLALVIVCLTLVTSIFTVWMVTRSTDKAVQQGVELQHEATKSVDDALKATKSQPGVTAEAQAQIDAAAAQLDAAQR